MALFTPLNILIVDDEESMAKSLQTILQNEGYKTLIAQNGEEALQKIPHSNLNLVITDLEMPGMDGFALVKKIKQQYSDLMVFIFTGHDSFSMARKAQQFGADDFLLKPLDKDQLTIALAQATEKIRLKNKIENLGKLVETKYSIQNIIGRSKPMQDVFRLIEKAQSTRANVFIQGESGTGKELVARAIYSYRATQKHNFVSVNCAAITEGLIESELFGHVRGSFSGAIADRTGLFETANNGTIFLDEIGDISPGLQTKLLRVLQEGEIRRVGENNIRNVNVRVIAATNKNLEQEVKVGNFREDLYYRLNVIPIYIPSLKDRKNDIPELVNHFLVKYNEGNDTKSFSVEAMQVLQSYQFPGNIRELENIVQRGISFSSNNVITKEEIKSYLPIDSILAEADPQLDFDNLSYQGLKDYMDELEKKYLINRLLESGGSVNTASNIINITRTAFHNKVKKYKIDLEDIRLKSGADPLK